MFYLSGNRLGEDASLGFAKDAKFGFWVSREHKRNWAKIGLNEKEWLRWLWALEPDVTSECLRYLRHRS